jgi:hypothetical protein
MSGFGLEFLLQRHPLGQGNSHIHKFGSNLALAGTSESIWSAGGLYPWASLATAQTIYAISTEAADTGTLEIQGLDENYALQTTTVTLTGLTAVDTGATTFLRIFRMQYTGSNAGTITARVTSGTGTVVAQIDPEVAQTLMAIYTVPAQTTAFMLAYTVGTGQGDDAHVKMFARELGGAFQIKNEMKSYQSTITREFPIPLRFEEKTDIDFRATTSSANSDCIVNFDLVLVK